MFNIESKCPNCGHKNQVEHETLNEMIEGVKNDLNISAKGLSKEDALHTIKVYDVDCQECSERYSLVDSANWDEIEKIAKKNL